MNLILDVGSTYIKLAVFRNITLVDKRSVKKEQALKSFKSFVKKHTSINQVIISSVGKLDGSILAHIKSSYRLLFLNAETKVPFINLYATPKTLGIDRIGLVSASVLKFPNKNVLIIDAGTCITYDFINAKNEYLGGSISPGVRMRYKALHYQTENLPLLNSQIPEATIEDSTSGSIHSGVINGVLNEIDGLVNFYKKNYSDLTVILTGGDANFLSKQLKSSIFANSNFLLEGLNYILQYNSN